MNFLTKFSLKNVTAIAILSVLVIAGGIFSAWQLNKETMPDVSIPIVGIITVYPGAAPSDVRDKITKPLEEAVMGVTGITAVNSTSSENISAVITQFDYSANMDEAQRKIEDSIKDLKFPDGVLEAKILRIDFGSFPVLNLSISNDRLSPEELESIVREKVLPKLLSVAGVGQAQLLSETSEAVYVKLMPEKLKKYNLTSQMVTQLLQAYNISFPAGTVSLDETVEPIRVSGKFSSLDELKNLQLPVIPDVQETMKNSFSQVGKNMATLGQTIGQIGQGTDSLSQAVGQISQGMEGINQALSGQIILLTAIQDLQARLFGAKIAVSEANLVLKNPASDDTQKQTANLTIQQLNPNIKILEAAIAQSQDKLKDIQQQISKETKNTGSKKKAEISTQLMTNARAGTQQATPSPTPVGLKKLETVTLGEIAEITVGTGATTSYSRTNGSPSVIVQILKTQDANTIYVSDAVHKKLAATEYMLPEGTKIDTILDQADSVNESVNGILKEGLLGAIFAFLVILLFLRNIRTTIIASLSIPLSILISLIFLKQLNITLNIVTLGGLSVAIGRIVDDSIVVIENIYRHLQSGTERNTDLIKLGTKEVVSAITSSTLTTVAVFIPMAFIDGIAGLMFKPFAITVSIALVSSLLVAVTVIPMMSKLLLLKSKRKKRLEFHESRLMNWYQGLLTWSLSHKPLVLLLAVVLFAGSISLFGSIGTSFMPEEKEKYVSITMSYPPGTEVKVVNKKAIEIEKILSSENEIAVFQTTIGSAGTSNPISAMSGTGDGSFLIRLKDSADVDAFVAMLRKKIGVDTSDKQYSIKAKITVNQTNVSTTSGAGGMNNLSIKITGDDFAKVKETAVQLTKDLESVQGIENISNNLSESKPEILVNVDQRKASENGLSAAQTGLVIRELLNDTSVTTMTVGKKSMDVLVGLQLSTVSKLEDVKNIMISTPLGGLVKISDIADVKEVPGPVSIHTEDGKENANITAKITEKNTGAVSANVQAKIDAMQLSEGVSVKMGGVSKMMKDTFNDLILAMIIAVFSVFFVMLVALGEAAAPLAILFSLPLAAIGCLFALFITKLPLDMPSMIGGLMLIGIVVTNAIVFIDRVQQRRREGMPVREALMEAGRIRMRPILMTAIATIAALIPLAMGISKGSVLSQSLAVIVIGGLTTSTFLTLVIVPVAYEMLESLKLKMMGGERADNLSTGQ